MMKYAEQVRLGHPDRIADLVSEQIVKAAIENDENSRCGIEVMIKGTDEHSINVVVSGEMTPLLGDDEISYIVETTLEKLFLIEPTDVNVLVFVTGQSEQIARNMNGNTSGDQCIVYGYADITQPRSLPFPYVIATEIMQYIDSDYDFFEPPDGKIIVGHDNHSGKLDIIASIQRPTDTDINYFEFVLNKEINRVLGIYNAESWVTINPGGDFVDGGVHCDSGITGRKIQCDTYGTLVLNGGGNLNGKDGTKIDRVGAYIARWIALNMSHIYESEVTTRLVYKMGDKYPINAYAYIDDGFSKRKIKIESYGILSVEEAIDHFDLREPYVFGAKYSHFYDDRFKWNQIL